MAQLLTTSQDVTTLPTDARSHPLSCKILMVKPTHFALDNPINAHMRTAQGTLHVCDKEVAFKQWSALVEIYKSLGCRVKVEEGVPGLPDMCFTANQSLPFCDELGKPKAVLSRMRTPMRNQEVPYIARMLESDGVTTVPLPPSCPDAYLEGMGDALWVPGKRFLCGGYGFRTSKETYECLGQVLHCPIALFELKNPRFYHLDTCLSLLNAHTALACQEAFTPEGWQLLQALFPTILVVPLEEADAPGFACNAFCPDGQHVILQQGSLRTCDVLTRHGLTVKEVDTSEFVKSGGSVFCLKLAYF